MLFFILTSWNQIYSQTIIWTETQPAGDVNKLWQTTSMSSDGSKLIAGVNGGRLYISINGGSSWTETQPAGDIDKQWSTTSMSSDGSKLIAGVDDGRLYLGESILTGIENDKTIPGQFILYQNYPNPFNPTTKISYQIPADDFVTLKIFDVLGREAATLINTNQTAGFYEVTFNAANLTSGVYFYKIEAGSFSSVKKLLLMK